MTDPTHRSPSCGPRGPLRIVLTANTGFNLVNFRAGLIAALLADGHELVALVPPSIHDGEIAAMGCRVVPLKMDARGLNPLSEIALIWRMRLAFRRLAPDVVLSWTIKNNLYGALAARPLGIPVVPNVTGLGTAFARRGSMLSWVAGRLYKRGLKGVAPVFVQNANDAELLLDGGFLTAGQIKSLPGSGVDLVRFAQAPFASSRAQVRFLMIARLLRDKGVADLVEALRIMRRWDVEAHVTVLGAFDDRDAGMVAARDLESWRRIDGLEFIAHVADVRPYLADADCIVLPSYYAEGLPRSLLEAAATGRPIITTDHPGCRDAIVPGQTGLLCRVRDPNDLARAMTEMIGIGPPARIDMGNAARRRAEQFFDERLVIAAYRRELADLSED